ncbi:low affinity iron permease family protein [Singulisphaera sp. Ch08]|uniref:Low affinity iron permease family protein n=1 Tax=Singulisphaera sp. Ch08 TaxID=3120278 RepID=A0AAU7CNR4_9BACT
MRHSEGQVLVSNPPIPITRRDLFTRVSDWTIRITGGRWGFLTALGVVIVWAVAGPFFHYSENWQLVINTGTTIVTFLMVFLIQGAQNRESKAIHLKLDELIMGVNHARNELVDIERLTDQQLDALSDRYRKVAQQYQHKLTECFPGDGCEELAAGENNKAAHITVK